MTTDERNELLDRVLSRLANNLPYGIDKLSHIGEGVELKLGYRDSCRQCYVGYISATVELTYDELADPEMDDWTFEQMVKDRWEAAHLASKKTKRNWPHD